jgi:DNA invertase Pin-like site-specific DNA recombinase
MRKVVAFAEFECEMIRERTRAGLAAARVEFLSSGRPALRRASFHDQPLARAVLPHPVRAARRGVYSDENRNAGPTS